MAARQRLLGLWAAALAMQAASGAAQTGAVTPERACAALAAEGLATSPWATNDDAFGGVVVRNYRCLSEPLPIHGGEGAFITAINYYVEGRLKERVETIRLVLNVHRPKTRAAGVRRFVQLAQRLFAKLDLDAPPELAAALPERRPATWRQDYGTVRFEVWEKPIQRLRLTIDLAPGRSAS